MNTFSLIVSSFVVCTGGQNRDNTNIYRGGDVKCLSGVKQLWLIINSMIVCLATTDDGKTVINPVIVTTYDCKASAASFQAKLLNDEGYYGNDAVKSNSIAYNPSWTWAYSGKTPKDKPKLGEKSRCNRELKSLTVNRAILESKKSRSETLKEKRDKARKSIVALKRKGSVSDSDSD